LNGAIYKADLRTGKGSILVQPRPGRQAAGIKFDPRTNYLYVAGVYTGHAYVYDATTGADVADFVMTTMTRTIVNDVAITRDAVYFTESFGPVFYRIPLNAGGRLPEASAIQEIPLRGDFEYLPNGFNSNGIVATPDGKSLIIVHGDLGRLYRVDPISGQATQIDVGAPRVGKDGSDGLVLVGRTLYNINFYNELIPIELNRDLTKGVIKPSITSPNFQGPATAARFGPSLYVVNAKLDIAPTPELTYTVSRVSR
jgi:sugar lactone lactonase YvrE